MPQIGSGSGGSYSYSQLRKLWISAGGDRSWSYIMAAIAIAESGGNPQAHNVNANGSVDAGLWQINSVHGYSLNYLYNPQDNAKAAVAVFNSSGPHAWSTYNSGAYKKYLPSGKSGSLNWGVFTSPESVDQGVDFTGKGRIPALDDAKITDVGHVNIIEGGGPWNEVIYQLQAGQNKGQYIYTMENFKPTVKKGQTVAKGQTIGEAPGASPFIETGFNKQPVGINPVAPLYPNPHSPKPAGIEMQNFIHETIGQGGTTPGLDPGSGSIVNAVTGGASSVLGVGGSVIKDLFGNPLSGIESLIMQGFFIIIGIALVMVGLALVAYTLMGKVGGANIIGVAQTQQRIGLSRSRIAESSRASMARESQAQARIEGQAEDRRIRAQKAQTARDREARSNQYRAKKAAGVPR